MENLNTIPHDNALKTHLSSLIGRIWKILPLKEQDNPYLMTNIESLSFELLGSYEAFPLLADSPEYITIVNTILYLESNDFTVSQCKREVFKCIRLIKILIEKNESGGDGDV